MTRLPSARQKKPIKTREDMVWGKWVPLISPKYGTMTSTIASWHAVRIRAGRCTEKEINRCKRRETTIYNIYICSYVFTAGNFF